MPITSNLLRLGSRYMALEHQFRFRYDLGFNNWILERQTPLVWLSRRDKVLIDVKESNHPAALCILF